MLMNSVCCSSIPTRERCLMKVWVQSCLWNGQNMYICPLSSLDKSVSTARLMHTNCKAIAVQQENVLRVQWSSSENSHRSL